MTAYGSETNITKIEATVTNRIYQLRLAVLQDGSVQGIVKSSPTKCN